ncbi:polyprenol monophosphomannose synthase [Patescibacteria group bacterium]|nr:MAG: polyprenol monophosphomannose synthase [Patescibacteria group bacterium]
MKIVIVIPTYNERKNISKLTEKIFALRIDGLEMIVVDDGSPDGTGDKVKKLGERFPVTLLAREKKRGLGSAYLAGFKKALEMGADFIFEMDADLSHDPDDVPRLLEPCLDGADLAIGSRRVAGGKIIGWGWARKFMSAGAMRLSRLILQLKNKDVTSGFRCWRREALLRIDLDKIKSNGYAFQEEILWRAQQAGLKIAEVPVIFVDREEGKSKLGWREVLEFFKVMLSLRAKRSNP